MRHSWRRTHRTGCTGVWRKRGKGSEQEAVKMAWRSISTSYVAAQPEARPAR
jgi:hypothetical protein